MAKVYERILLKDYLDKINFEKEKYNLVSIVMDPDEVSRAYSHDEHVHWQNIIDDIAYTDKMCTDGKTLLNYFVDYYSDKTTKYGRILVLYLGQYWDSID